jgi:hypothetical protein
MCQLLRSSEHARTISKILLATQPRSSYQRSGMFFLLMTLVPQLQRYVVIVTFIFINFIIRDHFKDYANPLTWLTMCDYPEDCGIGMSEVFNSEKMLLNIPSEIIPPCIRVSGEFFFMNDLLQQVSGEYYIPEHFFYIMT